MGLLTYLFSAGPVPDDPEGFHGALNYANPTSFYFQDRAGLPRWSRTSSIGRDHQRTNFEVVDPDESKMNHQGFFSNLLSRIFDAKPVRDWASSCSSVHPQELQQVKQRNAITTSFAHTDSAPAEPASYIDRTGFLPTRPISCSSTGHDLQFDRNMARVVCPAHCQKDQAARVIGLSVHPNESAVCSSAIADGVMPVQGGALVVTKGPPQMSYEGSSLAGNYVGVEAGANIVSDSYKTYAVDTIDQISSNVRIVGEDGYLSAMGRPELRTDKGWGSICGLNHHTAQHICRELGYRKGWKIPTARCGALCGPRGSVVAAKNLVCNGEETSLQSCTRLEPDEECRTHKHDSVVWCSNKNYPWDIEDGKLRLIDDAGQPTADGVGRLEMWRAGQWRPVNREQYSDGTAATACRSMGYGGIDLNYPATPCDQFEGGAKSYCGSRGPGISQLQCLGSEQDISQCSFKLVRTEFMPADKQPSPANNLVLKCVGYGGDPSGKAAKEQAPKPDPAPFVRLDLECSSTLPTTKLSQGPPGTTVLAHCPPGCGGPAGNKSSGDGTSGVFGTGIYAEKTPICAAAVHDGLLDKKRGGDIVVSVAHPQARYRGSDQNGVISEDMANPDKKKSLVVALPTEDLFARYAKVTSKTYAGASAMGSPLMPKLLVG
ncbi:unnamed protein product [Amoebophrya sp. A120]|nr:unnamed protein product [Amoebophrya sp. A120]|eukprot:GSA120T00015681001.1